MDVLDRIMGLGVTLTEEPFASWEPTSDKYLSYHAEKDGKILPFTTAELSPFLVKALIELFEKNNAGVGLALSPSISDSALVTELRDEDYTKILAYNPANGKFVGGLVPNDEEDFSILEGTVEVFKYAPLLALMPMFMDDPEFEEHFDNVEKLHKKGFGKCNQEELKKSIYIMSDNVTRRIHRDPGKLEYKITLLFPDDEIIPAMSELDIQARKYHPAKTYLGEFKILSSENDSAIPGLGFESKKGQYKIGNVKRRPEDDEALLKKGEPVLDEKLIDIAESFYLLRKNYPDFPAIWKSNLLLRGPSASGKSHGTKILAALWDLPHYTLTMNANTEFSDLTGTILPRTNNENLKEYMRKLPSLSDIIDNPEFSLSLMTGSEKLPIQYQPENPKEKLSFEKAVCRVWNDLVTERALENSGTEFEYFPSEFVKAVEHGGLVEIQEAAAVTNPGVFIGLNDLLDGYSIKLPDGRVIKRHQDCIVAFTTNETYEGLRPLNQSIISRCQKIVEMPLPPAEVLVDRALNTTPCKDKELLTDMVDVIYQLNDYMNKNAITDGSLDMRALNSWIGEVVIGKNPIEAAETTIITKCSQSAEVISEIRVAFNNLAFTTRYMKKRKTIR